MNCCGSEITFREHLPEIWQQASWLRVIEVFHLSVENKRRSRDDEIWLKSPFTREEKASMHVSLSENIYKDFSSGKGGGIMQFCREMLLRQGREMTMFEVAQWMVAEGISTVNSPESQSLCAQKNHRAEEGQPKATAGPNTTNPAIEVDLRRYLRADHPEWHRDNAEQWVSRRVVNPRGEIETYPHIHHMDGSYAVRLTRK